MAKLFQCPFSQLSVEGTDTPPFLPSRRRFRDCILTPTHPERQDLLEILSSRRDTVLPASAEDTCLLKKTEMGHLQAAGLRCGVTV